MKLIIDIPDKVKAIIDDNINACGLDIYDCVIIAVKNGTSLSESEDCVSRQAALSHKVYTETEEGWSGYTVDADIIEQLPPVTAEKVGRWIPVGEKLPEDGKRVMWCFKDGAIGIERYKCDAIDHFYPQQGQHGLEEAVAWMPLPEPYKASPTGAEGSEEE